MLIQDFKYFVNDFMLENLFFLFSKKNMSTVWRYGYDTLYGATDMIRLVDYSHFVSFLHGHRITWPEYFKQS